MGSSTHGCWVGSFEYAMQRRFARELAAGDVVYDLGANVGFYSLLASRSVGDSGRVYCFEPLARNITYLRKHIALNRLENCFVFEAAVSDADGTARFDPFADPSMGRLSDRGDDMVRTVRLDSLLERTQILPPNLMKIDIEGGEFAALKGGARTIEKYRPAIVLATHGVEVHQACVQFLAERKYRLEPLTGESVENTAELIARP